MSKEIENQGGFFDAGADADAHDAGGPVSQGGQSVHADDDLVSENSAEQGQSLDEVRDEQSKSKTESKAKRKKVFLIAGGVLLAVTGMVVMNAVKAGHKPPPVQSVEASDASDMKPRGSSMIDVPVSIASEVIPVPVSSVVSASAVQAIAQPSQSLVLSGGRPVSAVSSVSTGVTEGTALLATQFPNYQKPETKRDQFTGSLGSPAVPDSSEVDLLRSENAKLKTDVQQLQMEMSREKRPSAARNQRTIYKDRFVKSECPRVARVTADQVATPKLKLEPAISSLLMATPTVSAVPAIASSQASDPSRAIVSEFSKAGNAAPAAIAPIHVAKCEFKGSLVNRAWLMCDGSLVSVKAGDMLPFPYLEVIKVNDGQSSGSVLTSSGLVE